MHSSHEHHQHERRGDVEHGSRGGRGRRRGRGEGHGRSGGRGGGRHRARRGAVRASILTLLDERPMHGYEIITELETRSGGRWRPSPGSVYPALEKLEQHGIVTSTEVEDKRTFSLTDRGREILTELRAAGDDESPPWSDRHGDHLARGGDLRRHVSELVGQVRQIGRFGTAAQIEAAAGVLTDTTRRLYDILATAPSADEPDEPDEPTGEPIETGGPQES